MVSKEYKRIQKLRAKYQVAQDVREKVKGETYNRRVNRKINENGVGVGGVSGKRRKSASAIQKPRKRSYLKRNKRVYFTYF
jgi:hypothetical protein